MSLGFIELNNRIAALHTSKEGCTITFDKYPITPLFRKLHTCSSSQLPAFLAFAQTILSDPECEYYYNFNDNVLLLCAAQTTQPTTQTPTRTPPGTTQIRQLTPCDVQYVSVIINNAFA